MTREEQSRLSRSHAIHTGKKRSIADKDTDKTRQHHRHNMCCADTAPTSND